MLEVVFQCTDENKSKNENIRLLVNTGQFPSPLVPFVIHGRAECSAVHLYLSSASPASPSDSEAALSGVPMVGVCSPWSVNIRNYVFIWESPWKTPK